MKKLAAIHRSRINKMSHAAGHVVAERLRRRWTLALERMLDEGAGYDAIVQYLNARGAEISIDRSGSDPFSA